MSIKVFINGKQEEFEKEITISELLEIKKIRKEVVTVEYNEEIIKREDYDKIKLKDNDKIELVFFMGGGNEQL
jgi:thiamine biosynthesis protein ThiS